MIRWDDVGPRVRRENRVISCFSEQPRNFYEMFLSAVHRNPDGEALICSEDRLTWQAIDMLSSRLAAGFARRGVNHGSRVALLLGNRVKFVVVVIASARRAAIVVPLNTRQQKPTISQLLSRTEPKLIIYEADLAHLVPSDSCHGVSSGCAGNPVAYDDLLEDGLESEPADVNEGDILFIIPTSGTTSCPKVPMVSHLRVVHSGVGFAANLGSTSSDRTIIASLLVTPLVLS